MHRDFKLDNVVLKNGNIKVIDLGLLKSYNFNSYASSFCGTSSTMAPEVWDRESPYDSRADIWSLGVVLY